MKLGDVEDFVRVCVKATAFRETTHFHEKCEERGIEKEEVTGLIVHDNAKGILVQDEQKQKYRLIYKKDSKKESIENWP